MKIFYVFFLIYFSYFFKNSGSFGHQKKSGVIGTRLANALKTVTLRTWDSWQGVGKTFLSCSLITTSFILLRKIQSDIAKNSIDNYPNLLLKILNNNRGFIYKNSDNLKKVIPFLTILPINNYYKTKTKNEEMAKLILILSEADRDLTFCNENKKNTYEFEYKEEDNYYLHTFFGYQTFVDDHYWIREFLRKLGDIEPYVETHTTILDKGYNTKAKKALLEIKEVFREIIVEYDKYKTEYLLPHQLDDLKNKHLLVPYRNMINNIEELIQNENLIIKIIHNHFLLLMSSISVTLFTLYIIYFIEKYGISSQTKCIQFIIKHTQNTFFSSSGKKLIDLILDNINPIYVLSNLILYTLPLFSANIGIKEYHYNKQNLSFTLEKAKILYTTTPDNYLKEKETYHETFEKISQDDRFKKIKNYINNGDLLSALNNLCQLLTLKDIIIKE